MKWWWKSDIERNGDRNNDIRRNGGWKERKIMIKWYITKLWWKKKIGWNRDERWKNNVERNGGGKRMIGDEIVVGKTIGDEMVIKGRNDDEKAV